MNPTDRKNTNPKDAVGTAKVPFSTISAPVLGELGLAMLEGARKYGRHNFRHSGVRASVYYDAALRHLAAFWEGQNIDPDSGLPHVVKAIACCVVLRDSQIQGNWVDDRPPKSPDGWVRELNDKARALIEKYPDPAAAFTEIATEKQDLIDSFHRDLAEDAETVVEPEKTADAYNTMNPVFAHKHFGFPENPACWEDATAEDGSRWVYRDTSGWGVGYWEKMPTVRLLTEAERDHDWTDKFGRLRYRWRDGKWMVNTIGSDGWIYIDLGEYYFGPYTRIS